MAGVTAGPEVSGLVSKGGRKWKRNSNTCIDIMEDLIYQVVTLYPLYIPVSFRNHLLDYFHQDPLFGHLGRHKTYRRLQHLVY